MEHAGGVANDMPFHLLEEITNGFSEERKIGSGSYTKVYLGVHKSGQKIAVKMLHDILDDEQFQNEAQNLMRIKHQNIVQFLGYCNETRRKYIEHNGRLVLTEKTSMALCFELMYKGSLRKHLSDESGGLDWHTRYKIIKGTCEGLKYLHELNDPIYHLDLKPSNILLDRNMLPKLANFGLSKFFGDEQTQITLDCVGTRGYTPPEYLAGNVVSKKFDIFSLGVIIIKIMTGPTCNWRSDDLSSQQFVELVHDNWSNRLQGQSFCCQQVRTCIEIALSCVTTDRHKRPTIGDIIHKLNETEVMIDEVSLCSSEVKTLFGQISAVSELVDEVKSMAVSAAPSEIQPSVLVNLNQYSQQAEKEYTELQQVSGSKGPGETSYESYDDDGPSLSSSITSGPASEMVDQASELKALEHILEDISTEPTKLSYALLQFITKNFCKAIGRGGFAVVYEGVLPNGRKVAVKKLSIPHDFSDEAFVDEIKCLIKAKHSNVVRFLGYCATTQGELREYNGSCVIADAPKRLLCFEYISNGSLHRYLKEKSHGDEWEIRYQMIKGICRGLHYLHDTRINHLDLKPGNILLDHRMEPKIVDFGLSRCFDEGQTRIFTKNINGTRGYIAPEIIDGGEISFKSDIFALGIIIIKLLLGRNTYDIGNWHESLNMDCPRVRSCTRIAQACVDTNHRNRPAIDEIIHKLNELETMTESPAIH